VKYAALVVVVIALGTAIGYYVIGGARDTHSVSAIPTTPAPAAETTVSPPAKSVAQIHPHATNGNYTAPGAPHIRIVEEKTPSLTDETHTSSDDTPPRSTASSDSEASQESAPTPATQSASASAGDQTSDTPSSPPPADSSAAPDTASSSSDADYEKTTVHSDTGAAQVTANAVSGRALFRVQTGSFAAARNAKILADALRNRGYNASTRSERDGDKTVYKVQTGAYRTKAAAGKAALDLQREGYPAYVSAVSP
jgi:cell division septation protein DedD